MAAPRRRRHRFSKRARRKPRRSKKSRPRKMPREGTTQAPEEGVLIRHYGDAWDYEAYEKEELKAKGLFL